MSNKYLIVAGNDVFKLTSAIANTAGTGFIWLKIVILSPIWKSY
ncbi:hypothetical protein [Nostoc sp. CHAB 5836]|nr:hypothetical protein [Nostoc sp. CHAB 5836]